MVPIVVAAAVTTVASPASGQTATVWGAAGLGVPTSDAPGSPFQGAESLVLDPRIAVDFGSILQVGAGVWVLAPGVDGPLSGAGAGNGAFAAMAEGRLFPIRIGVVRPYLGVGVGYAGSWYRTPAPCFQLVCDGDPHFGPSGPTLSPLGGVRLDFPSSKRTVSLYVEGGYQGTFSAPALDRVFVQVGPGISL